MRGEAWGVIQGPEVGEKLHLLAELRLIGAALSAQLLTYYPTQHGAWAANVAFLSSFLPSPSLLSFYEPTE